MAKLKMKYGIDLGTTNSAICKMENGEPTIKKTDTLKDTLPSCDYFNKKKSLIVGDAAYEALRIVLAQQKHGATRLRMSLLSSSVQWVLILCTKVPIWDADIVVKNYRQKY